MNERFKETKFNASWYNEIFIFMRHRFGEKWYASVDWKKWGVIWRHQIKGLFKKGILIKEILYAITQAAEKKQWPVDTAFFHRVEDVVYERRTKARRRRSMEVNRGLEGIGGVMDRLTRERESKR